MANQRKKKDRRMERTETIDLINISDCCNSSTKIIGNVTKHYRCMECKKPCDTHKKREEQQEAKELVDRFEELDDPHDDTSPIGSYYHNSKQ